MNPIALLAFAAACEAASQKEGKAVITEDIAVRARGGAAALPLPAPGAGPAVADEVAQSLRIMTSRHAVRASGSALPGAAARLARPFPGPPFLAFSPRSVSAPYDLWAFEVVMDGHEVLWRQEGTGRVVEPIEWDGTGPSGDDAVRVGRSYSYRFVGRQGADAFTLASDPVVLNSLALRELLGGMKLEVANDVLFKPKSAEFADGASDYLRELADRLRRAAAPQTGYALELRSTEPGAALTAKRAKALRQRMADELVINSALVKIETLSTGVRGDVTSVRLAAERGETIRE